MADQLNMNGLSLTDSKHASTMPNGRPAYIPPHMRGQPARSGPPPMDGPATLPPDGNLGLGGSAWGNPTYVQPLNEDARNMPIDSLKCQEANMMIVL
jgi:hypothetical protein